MSRTISLNVKIDPNTEVSPIAVLETLMRNGWTAYNEGNLTYLPFGDNGLYNWQTDAFSDKELFQILSKKLKYNETIGVNIYNSSTLAGVSLLCFEKNIYTFELGLYTKYLNKSKYLIDYNWYSENLLKHLIDNFPVYAYEFSFIY
ncbi:hypothetical protein LJB90_02585 [Eubacteriales bacterium OttesenSCG-928-G02]|nr:hypothetical protein [Eubacteriales bacterium OttesenSCG-928-G02]